MDSSPDAKRRQERIGRAIRELSQAIEHGEGVDLALDHLSEARRTGHDRRCHAGSRRR